MHTLFPTPFVLTEFISLTVAGTCIMTCSVGVFIVGQLALGLAFLFGFMSMFGFVFGFRLQFPFGLAF